jgi:MFS transporter, ACS family, tartrate transporter
LRSDPGTAALAKVRRHLVVFLGALYFAAFIDRVNVGFAAQQMHRDLGFSASVYGFGAGIFFIGYCLFEIPSNLILHRVGARRWIGRIMISWALLAGAMAFVKGAAGFYTLRFVLGVAEAGFFPGVIYYLTYWVPAAERARLVGTFMTAIPVSIALAGPVSAAILGLDGRLGLAGWQWLFLTETVPSLLLGVVTLKTLPDTPADAHWLTAEERNWLAARLAVDTPPPRAPRAHSVLEALIHPRMLALALCYFGADLGLYGIILWIPQIFASAGVAPGAVGYVVAIPYAIAAAGMVYWCRRSDRSRERVWHIACASLVGFTGITLSAALRSSPVLSVAAVTVGATGTLAMLPIFWTLPASLLRGAPAAGAIALINAIGNIGGFVGPFAMGWIRDATGSFTWGLMVVAAGILLTGVSALLVGHDARAEYGDDALGQPAPRLDGA